MHTPAPVLQPRGRRLRVLHVYRTGFPDSQGGTEEHLRTLSRGLLRRGVDVDLLFPSRQVPAVSSHLDEGVQVWRVPETVEIASCNIFFRGIAQFRRLALAADVVHYHFPWPWGDVLHALVPAQARCRHVVTYHSDIVRQRLLALPYRPLMHRFLGSVDRIVATSQAYADSSPVLSRRLDRTCVIPLGMDSLRIPPIEPRRRERWLAEVGEGFFFFVGVLRYYKALHVLVRASAASGLPVVIAGDGPEAARLHALAARIGASRVRFTGRIGDEDKWALFGLARAFVLPSDQRSEAFGVSLLEAMHFGLPMITAAIGTGTGFVNVADLTGLHVQPGDPVALARAMERLAQDDALRARMGVAANERLSRCFGADAMVDAHIGLYEELLHGRG
jgi:rhamnosyl/mannosyltransferase